MTSITTSAAGADFTQITADLSALADAVGVEIIGCAKGFNVWKDGDILSEDCTPSELRQWLQGLRYGQEFWPIPSDFKATALDVPAQKVAAAIATANGMCWKLDVAGEEITITGRKFKETITGWPALLAFIKGFESSCYTQDLMFESIEDFEAGVPAAGTNGSAV